MTKAAVSYHRKTSAIKYIVIHYTANDGDTDEGNGKYFHNSIVKASAHYFVDSDSVTQSVPDDYTAYSVGGSKYGNCKTTGAGSFTESVRTVTASASSCAMTRRIRRFIPQPQLSGMRWSLQGI